MPVRLPQKLRQGLLLAVKAVVSIGLLYFIFTLVDVRKALGAAAGVNLVLLALAALIRGGVFCLDALRLHWMTPVIGLPYTQHLRLALRGALFSQLGFGFLTGDAYRAVGYARQAGGLSGPAAHLLAARLAGISMTAMMALAAALFLVISDSGDMRDFALRMGFGVLGASVIIIGILWLSLKFLPRHASPAMQKRLAHATQALKSLSPKIWTLSLVVIFLRGLSLWVVFMALHFQISYFVPLLASVTGTLITLLPLAFGGLGLREGTLAGVCVLFGAPGAISVSAAILLRLAIISAAFAGFVVSLFLPAVPPKAD